MVERTEPLWASGPGEIMRHGVGLLSKDSDANRRLALIAIDNAVELMLKTYIDLPKRITGLELSRKQRDEISVNFPSMLDGLEEHAPDRMVGLSLGEIEWFHRLRNNLYHNGNGLTVERQKVEIYAELASTLFSQLFGTSVDIGASGGMERLGEFVYLWSSIERRMYELTKIDKRAPSFTNLDRLKKLGILDSKVMSRILNLRSIRNEVVHFSNNHSKVVDKETVEEAKALLKILEETEGPF